jgi:predicted ATPase
VPPYARTSGPTCWKGGQQCALSWELRTAISLARLKHRQGRSDEAFAVLAPVCKRFHEGFGTADLQHATMLLDDLA